MDHRIDYRTDQERHEFSMHMMKRLFDIIFSLVGLIILSPLFLIMAVLVKLDSSGPVFFKHMRVGMGFRPFQVYKFRTMITGAEYQGAPVTAAGDKRVTRLGRLLRRYKIDELPQLVNVLRGDMSLVGPRPEVREFVELYVSDYKKLLTVRPGITDPASMHYAEEERVLAKSVDWEEDYKKKVLPNKIKLSLQYVENHSLMTDISLIIKTVMKAARMV